MLCFFFLPVDIASLLSCRKAGRGVQQAGGCKPQHGGVQEGKHSCTFPLSAQRPDHADPVGGQGGLDHHAEQIWNLYV